MAQGEMPFSLYDSSNKKFVAWPTYKDCNPALRI